MTTFEGLSLDETPGIGALTLGGFLDEVTKRFADAEALVLADDLRDGEVVRWSYADLGDEAHRLARALVAVGVQPGETVGVLMGNRPEAVAALFAVALIGAVVAPMSTFAAPPEVIEMVRRSRAVVVLTQGRLQRRRLGDEVAGAHTSLGLLRSVAVVGEPSWDHFVAAGDPVSDDEVTRRSNAVTPDDPALVIFTSGTTSRPKAILHAHRSPTLQFWLQATIFGRDRATRMYSALPLFWTAGLNTAMGATMAAGGCWVMHEVFEPGEALRLLAAERVTEPYTLPHQTAALAEHPGWATTDLSSLRCVYGKGAYARHPTVDGDPGWVMPVGYGLSETCAFVSGHPSDTPRERIRIGHGPLLAGTRVRIVGDDGADVTAGVDGHILVGGATLMLGYLDDGTVDTGAIADGFFRTGDVGSVDGDGVLHYAGRTTEMIKTAGANVSPAEIEVQLRRVPEIVISRVLGIPDERIGEAVVACVVRRDGAALDEATVRSFLRERLAPYKVPRHVVFLDAGEMPMTDADSKVRDAALRELVAGRLAAPAVPTTTPGGAQ